MRRHSNKGIVRGVLGTLLAFVLLVPVAPTYAGDSEGVAGRTRKISFEVEVAGGSVVHPPAQQSGQTPNENEPRAQKDVAPAIPSVFRANHYLHVALSYFWLMRR